MKLSTNNPPRLHGAKALLLTLLFMCFGAVSAWADNATIKVTLKCNEPSHISFTQSVPTSRNANNTNAPSITWSSAPGDDGYYTATYTASPYYGNIIGLKTGYQMTFSVKAKGDYYISKLVGASATLPTNSSVTLVSGKYTSNQDFSVTIDVYPAVTNYWDNGQTLNIAAGDNAGMASFKWNNEAMSGSSVTNPHSGSYRTVNGVYLDGDKPSTLENSITVTPSESTVTVNWEFLNGTTVVKSGKVTGGSNVEILKWTSKTTDYNGYTLRYSCKKPVIVEQAATSTETISFPDHDPAKYTIHWTVKNSENLNCSGASASYTHNWTAKYDQETNELLNPLDGCFDNQLSLKLANGYQAICHLEKYDGQLGDWTEIAGQYIVGDGTDQEITSWTDPTLVDGARLRIETSINLGQNYFYLKANPDHFNDIRCSYGNGGWAYSEADSWSLNYSLDGDGEPNVLNTNNVYVKFFAKDGVTYTINRYKQDGTNSNTYSGKTGEYSFNLGASGMKGRVVVDSELLLTGGPWNYTIVADPDKFDFQDNYNNAAATLNASLTGATNTSSAIKILPRIKVKNAANKTEAEKVRWSAYFYKEGVDHTNHDNAFAKRENVKGTLDYTYLLATALGTQAEFTNAEYNNAVIVVEYVEGIGVGTITVKVNGDPSKVTMTNPNSPVDKNEQPISETFEAGDNSFELTTGIMNFKKKPATGQFCSFMRNGVEISPRKDTSGTNDEWAYAFNDVKGGDVFEIEVDFPDRNQTVSFTLPEGCEDFLDEVYVVDTDGNATLQGKPYSGSFTVRAGGNIRFVGDTYNFLVNDITVNGESLANIGTSIALNRILEDKAVVFDITRIARDKSFTLDLSHEFVGGVKVTSAMGSTRSINDLYVANVTFNSDDNPFTFVSSLSKAGEDENSADSHDEENGGDGDYLRAIWYVNDLIVQADGATTFVGSVNNGDVVKVEYLLGKDYPTVYEVDIQLGGNLGNIGEYPRTLLNGTTETTKRHLNIPAGQTILVLGTENIEVEYAQIGSNKYYPDVNGELWLTINANATIRLYGHTVQYNRDATVVYYFDDANLANEVYTARGRKINLKNELDEFGYGSFLIDPEKENPLSFNFPSGQVFFYHNDAAQQASCSLELRDNDVLKVYSKLELDEEETPETENVTFILPEGSNTVPRIWIDKVNLLYSDVVIPNDDTESWTNVSQLDVLPYTLVTIGQNTGDYKDYFKFTTVYVDTQVGPTEAPVRRVLGAAERHDVYTPGADGKVRFAVDQPVTVRFDLDEGSITTTIETISYDADAFANGDVYDLRGVLVRRAAQGLDGLAPGFYIRGGQKFLVK